jgi:transcriptional regulator with XRE-family HTH domain
MTVKRGQTWVESILCLFSKWLAHDSVSFITIFSGLGVETEHSQHRVCRLRRGKSMRYPEEFVPNERLRRARSLKGWSQAEVADKVGTSFEMVSRWERGITIPNPYYRERICAVLGQTPEELGFRSDHHDSLATSQSLSVFLASSHADAGHEFVARLKLDLKAQGITTLSSRAVRRQGDGNTRKVLQETIRASLGVMVIVSPDARTSRHIQEALQLAKIYRRPVYAVWIKGEDWQECFPRDDSELFITIDARQGYDSFQLDEIITTLKQAQLATSKDRDSSVTANDVPERFTRPRNPYKGLRAFHREDAQDFFGRDVLIGELTQALEASLHAEKKRSQSARLLAVVGPSGSGKSSIVMAGLLPRLQSGGLHGSEMWIYLDPIVPGVHPIESLTLALAEKLSDKSLQTIRADLEDDSGRGLHLLAATLAKHEGTRVALLVDQFEELFTLTASEEERGQFIALLINALTEPHGPVVILLTLRADFSDRPMHYPVLGQLIEEHHKSVFAMSISDLRAIIEQPAKLPDVQLTFQGDLVSDLLFEVQGMVGALPLLQFTLDQLFQRRSGHQLTLQSYREIGGVKGALAKQAETTYAALPSEEHRRLARVLFLRLIDPGMTEHDTTRRRAALSEFSLVSTTQTRLTAETIEAFTASRLLTSNTIAGIPSLEVSHEALIREWARLFDWLSESREDIRFQQSLSEDVAEWEQRDKPRDRLYRGSQLKEAQAWVGHNMPSRNEAAFLHASARRSMRSRVNVLAILLLFVVTVGIALKLLLLVLSAPNPTYVTNLGDQGVGTLRWAIDVASPGSTITFAPTLKGTIELVTNNLDISKNLSIRGPGTGTLAISNGNTGYSILVPPAVSVSISGLAFKNSMTLQNNLINNTYEITIINCQITKSVRQNRSINNSDIFKNINSNIYNNVGYEGGGINNNDLLEITNSTISNNIASGRGGGIFNTGQLEITNSIISNNSTYGQGGGIFNSDILRIANSSVSTNTAQAEGGGIFNTNSVDFTQNSLEITNSTISSNRSDGNGGGIFNSSDTRSISVILSNSFVSGNIAVGKGGGIDNNGFFDIANSTISANKALNEGGGIESPGGLILTNSTVSDNSALSYGGGIAVSFLSYTIDFCTIYGNTATQDGGGIAIYQNRSKVPFQDDHGKGIGESILAGNHARTSPNISGMIRSHGYNLIQYFTSSTNFVPLKLQSTDVEVSTSSFLGIDSLLRNNGGQTLTHALIRGSPAIDSIPPGTCQLIGITTDQRGVKRPQGNGCDIGAYEYKSYP